MGPATVEVFVDTLLIVLCYLFLWRELLVRDEVVLFVLFIFLFVLGNVILHVKVHDVRVGDLIVRLGDYTPEKHVFKIGVLLSLAGSSSRR